MTLNLKVRTKIIIGFMVVLVFTAVLGINSSVSLNQVNTSYSDAIENLVQPLTELMEVEIAFSNVRQTSRGFLIRIMQDPSVLEAQSERLRGLSDNMYNALDVYFQTLDVIDPNDPKLITAKEIQTIYINDFQPKLNIMIDTAATGDLIQMVAMLDATNADSDKVFLGIQDLYAMTMEQMDDIRTENTSAAKLNIIVNIILAVAALVIGLIIGFLVSNSISKPVNRLVSLISEVTQGNLNVNVDRTNNSKDEIDHGKVLKIWESLVNTPICDNKPVWIHADLLKSNILIKNNHISGIIDFGSAGIGDPAFDIIPAWSLFNLENRNNFKEKIEICDIIWDRACAYALHQAVIGIPYYRKTNENFVKQSLFTINEIIKDKIL